MKLKTLLFSFLLSILCAGALAQPANDLCGNAIPLTVGTTCSGTSGTTTSATMSFTGCSGNADDDVWYTFVANNDTNVITVIPAAGFDAVIEIHSACTAANLFCRDVSPAGVTEVLSATGLTVGTTYKVRVYHFGAGSGTGSFSICVTGPSVPSNNICSNAMSLNVSTGCSYTSGTTFQATQSFASNCTATADDDVWYSFSATAATQTITVHPSTGFNAVIELHESCSSTNLFCSNSAGTGADEILVATGLDPGNTYLVRVYHSGNGPGSGTFDICVTGPNSPGPPVNDNPCGAIALPTVSSNCNYGNYTTDYATETPVSLAPVPSSCSNGVADGGFSTDIVEDVWFSAVVPSTGQLFIQAYPNVSAGYISDGAMALYSGSCGSLTQIACSEDHPAYPGSTYDNLPYINASSLTPGSTVYIRYWAVADNAPGSFGMCVSSATNDACSTALYVCDLNGYSASTSSAFTPDRPGNMRGNAETAGTYVYTPGTNQNGIFGQAPPFNPSGGAANYDVQIDNNSWVRFTAGASTATFTVTIGNCWINQGIQMQIFSANNCANFAVVSDFKEGPNNFTVSAQGLTPYQDYYLMIDGFAGDICNYTIAALSGVLLPEITAADPSICSSDTTQLLGPAGASSYAWSTGATTQNISVHPTVTTTYTLVAGGVCGQTQTLTKTIVVNQPPAIQVNGGNPVTVCSSSSVNLVASGASSYVWNTTATTASINVSPAGNTTYTVTGTDANGCVGQAAVTVTVNPTPVLTTPSSQVFCGNTVSTAISFSTNPSATVNWTNNNTNTGPTGTGLTQASGSNTINPFTTQTVTSPQTGVITATPILNGCTGIAKQFTITVNPTPVITAISDVTVCGNGVVPTTNFSVTPGTSTGFTWTNNNTATGLTNTSGTGSVTSFTASNVSTLTTSTITVSTSLNNCPATNAVYHINVNPLPVLTVTPSEVQSGCGVATGALNNATASGSGTLSYNWTNSSNVSVGTSANLTNVPADSYNLSVTDANCTARFGPFDVTNPGAPAQPTVTSSSGLDLCVGESLSLTASSTETNPSFAWTGPNANSSSSTLNIGSVGLSDAGTYTVTITLPTNCTSTKTVSVAVHANPVPSAASSGTGYCSGSQIDFFGSGGTGYQWQGPNAYSSTAQNPSILNSDAGMSGTYTLTVTDAAGCQANATASINVYTTPPVPVINANNLTLCVGEQLQLNATSAGATTYAWSGPGAFASSQQNPSIDSMTVVQAGIYTVSASTPNCTSPAASVTVAVNQNPAISLSANASVICSGNNIDLNSTGGGNYSWTGPNAYTSSQQNPSIPAATVVMGGTYILTVTNANNCSTIDSVSVLVNATPSVPSITPGDTSLCVGDSLQLQATSAGATSFNWTGPLSYTSGQQNPLLTNVSVPQSGTYTVTASASNCTSAQGTVTVIVNSIPVIAATPALTTACSGDTISITGTGGGSYSWAGPNAFSSSLAVLQLNNAGTQMSGTYTLTVITNGCRAVDSAQVLVNATPGTPAITANATSLCEGNDLQLGANAASATGYNWTGPNGYNSAGQNQLINAATPANSGTYTVVATANGCTSPSETVAIIVNATPVATATVSTNLICSGNSLDLTASGGTTFTWAGPNGFTSTQQNNTLTNIDVAASGTYTYVAINAGNCTDTATVDVTVSQTPLPALTTGSSTCNGSPVVLTANGNGTINWYSDTSLTNLVSNNDTLFPNLPMNTSAVYYVTISGNGCTSTAVAVNASNYTIDAVFSASTLSGYTPLPVTFTNQSVGVDANDTFNWLVGTSSFATTYNSSYTFTQGGSSVVTLIVTDNPSGCVDTASVTVFVDDEIKIVIPNIFTPNGDGTNDGFALQLKGVKEAQGMIFNRWGQLLHEWDALNATWDGKLANGQSVTDGIYFYIIRVTEYDGDVQDVPGTVTIVR